MYEIATQARVSTAYQLQVRQLQITTFCSKMFLVDSSLVPASDLLCNCSGVCVTDESGHPKCECDEPKECVSSYCGELSSHVFCDHCPLFHCSWRHNLSGWFLCNK